MLNSLLHSPMNTGDWVGVLLLVGTAGGLIVGAIAIITEHYRQAARDEMDTALKMEMLERGMNAEDIIKVLEATGGPQHDDGSGHQVQHGRRHHHRGRSRHSWHERQAMHKAIESAPHGSNGA